MLNLRVNLSSYKDKEMWDEYVLNNSFSTGYHLFSWKNVIEKTFKHKTFYFSAKKDSKIVGILPLVLMKSILFGKFLISLPYLNYGGILAEDSEVEKALLKEAISLAKEEKVDFIELRHIEKKDYLNLKTKTSKVTFFLKLPESSEILWKSFKSKLRSQIKRAMKENMEVKFGKFEELNNFYNIFAKNMRDLGTPVYTKRFFENILKEFPENSIICSVYYKDKAIASAFLWSFKDTLEIPWASSIRKYNRLAPNMLLYWSILKFGCNKKFKYFDFGRCTPNTGTYKFKTQWGGEEKQLFWDYWLKDRDDLPEINPKNPKYKIFIKIWQKLPVFITKIIGPPIVKYIP